MQIIPSKNDSNYRQQVELNGETFILFYKWNALNQFWSLSIYDSNSNPIVTGIKIVTQFNLTEQLIRLGMPLGDIICQNIIGGFERIQRNDLGETNELIF